MISLMSWQKVFFGVADPSRERFLGVTVTAVVFALAAYGFWADFVPSDDVASLSFYASVAIGSISAFLFFRRLGHEALLGPAGKSKLVQWFFIIMTPAFLIFLIWAALGNGAPAMYTAIAGTPYTEDVQLSKSRGGGRRTCSYRLEGAAISKALPSYICIGESAFESLPHGGLMFQLVGRKSVFGVLYERVERI